MRCADFHVFSLRVQGPQPLPPTAQVILPSCRRQRIREPARSPNTRLYLPVALC